MSEEVSCTFAKEAEAEPITVESLWKIYTEAWIVPMTFKPTGELVYVTPQMADRIDAAKEAQ